MIPLFASTLTKDGLIIILDLTATPPTGEDVVPFSRTRHASFISCREVRVVLVKQTNKKFNITLGIFEHKHDLKLINVLENQTFLNVEHEILRTGTVEYPDPTLQLPP